LCDNISWMKPQYSTSKLVEINPSYEPQEEGTLWWLPSPSFGNDDKKNTGIIENYLSRFEILGAGLDGFDYI